MAKFRIQPHGRLHEWIAEEHGYFADAGLDYVFSPDKSNSQESNVRMAMELGQDDIKTGAYEILEKETTCDVSAACHWAVNQAAAMDRGKMWSRAYSVTSGGIYVAPESAAKKPADLAGISVAVGYHSGSHFATLQALESFLEPKEISLTYIGAPMERVSAALDRKSVATSIWGAGQYIVEQQGFRKIADLTFMIGFLFPTAVEDDDIEKYMEALKNAQMDIDLQPDRYKEYYLKEIPEHFHDIIDVRGFGTGERIVFLPYTKKMYDQTQEWMAARNLFDAGARPRAYEEAIRE